MAAVGFTTTIARAPEDVFDLLADVSRNAEWSPGFAGAQKLTAGPIGPGTAFRTTAKGIGPMEIRIEGYDRPSRLDFRAVTPSVHISHDFALSRDPAGTRVAQRIEVRPTGPRRILAPLLGLMLRRTIRQNTADLTRYLERGASCVERPDRA